MRSSRISNLFNLPTSIPQNFLKTQKVATLPTWPPGPRPVPRCETGGPWGFEEAEDPPHGRVWPPLHPLPMQS